MGCNSELTHITLPFSGILIQAMYVINGAIVFLCTGSLYIGTNVWNE